MWEFPFHSSSNCLARNRFRVRARLVFAVLTCCLSLSAWGGTTAENDTRVATQVSNPCAPHERWTFGTELGESVPAQSRDQFSHFLAGDLLPSRSFEAASLLKEHSSDEAARAFADY